MKLLRWAITSSSTAITEEAITGKRTINARDHVVAPGFIDTHFPLNDWPSAFFSVSLSAAGNEKQQDDATRCLNEFLDETGWHPVATSIIAGALLY